MNMDDVEERVRDARGVWGQFLKIFGKVQVDYYDHEWPDTDARLPGMFVVFHLRSDVPFREFAFSLAKTEASSSIQ